jgi:serine/threonine protein kinase
MRELRHPFLLSVERIEIVDGRLIIVTELAEGSLEQSFREIQRQGQKGIPRDTLLDYLRDAADALDFMHQRHGLQHLDIKPGNLLLQGGHVKVADFGLIKDLRHACASMIKGFTPLYAPPELFEAQSPREQRPVQPGDRLPGDAHGDSALCRPQHGAAHVAAPEQPARPDASWRPRTAPPWPARCRRTPAPASPPAGSSSTILRGEVRRWPGRVRAGPRTGTVPRG